MPNETRIFTIDRVAAVRTCALLCVFAACGDNSDTLPDAGPDPQPDVAVPQVMHGGILRTLDLSKPVGDMQPVLAGAEICVVEGAEPHCVTSAADGRWAINLPPNNDDIRITFTAPGHLSLYLVWFSEDRDNLELTLHLISDAIVSSFYSSCGGSYPEQQAGILLQGFRFSPPDDYRYLSGAVASVPAGMGPCYFETPYAHDPQQLTTTEPGLGMTLFGNVPVAAGSADTTISLAGTTCYSHRNLVDTATPNVIRVPLRAGFQTVLDIVCE